MGLWSDGTTKTQLAQHFTRIKWKATPLLLEPSIHRPCRPSLGQARMLMRGWGWERKAVASRNMKRDITLQKVRQGENCNGA